MKRFGIKVDTVVYYIEQDQSAYNIIVEGMIVMHVKAIVGKNLHFNWETLDGQRSHLIDRIGLKIENHGLMFSL